MQLKSTELIVCGEWGESGENGILKKKNTWFYLIIYLLKEFLYYTFK